MHKKEKKGDKRKGKLSSAQNRTQDLLHTGPFLCHYTTWGHTTSCVMKNPTSKHLKNRCPTIKLIRYTLMIIYEVGCKKSTYQLLKVAAKKTKPLVRNMTKASHTSLC